MNELKIKLERGLGRSEFLVVNKKLSTKLTGGVVWEYEQIKIILFKIHY